MVVLNSYSSSFQVNMLFIVCLSAVVYCVTRKYQIFFFAFKSFQYLPRDTTKHFKNQTRGLKSRRITLKSYKAFLFVLNINGLSEKKKIKIQSKIFLQLCHPEVSLLIKKQVCLNTPVTVYIQHLHVIKCKHQKAFALNTTMFMIDGKKINGRHLSIKPPRTISFHRLHHRNQVNWAARQTVYRIYSFVTSKHCASPSPFQKRPFSPSQNS